MVLQRSQANTASLYIAGQYSIPVDRIETQLVPATTTNRVYVDRTVLQDHPSNGLYQSSLTAPAGIFRLEVRGIRDEKRLAVRLFPPWVLARCSSSRGQSNAMSLPNLGAKGASGRVVSFNAGL